MKKTVLLILAALVSGFAFLVSGHADPPTTTGAPTLPGSTNTWSGTNNFTGTLQLGGVSIGTVISNDLAAFAGSSNIVTLGTLTSFAVSDGSNSIYSTGNGLSIQVAAGGVINFLVDPGSTGTYNLTIPPQSGDVTLMTEQESIPFSRLTTLPAGINELTTGALGYDQGGTGQQFYTDGQLLIGNTSTTGISKATLTAGTNIAITNGHGTITIGFTGTLPVANGGTGTGSPGIVAGTNVTVTGTWPNQTVAASGTLRAFQTTQDNTTCLSNTTPTNSQMITGTVAVGVHAVHVHISVEGDASNTGLFWRLHMGSGAATSFQRAAYFDTNVGYFNEITDLFSGTTEATLASQVHVFDAWGSINVTTAGTIAVQISQATSSAVATPVYAGSFIEVSP